MKSDVKHFSFTLKLSADGTETWMVYHGTVNTTHIDGFRIARIEKIDWSEDGIPLFPRPHGYSNPQPVPSGQRIV
jgi:GH43 family beta-xylosidase